ncbi:receptor-type tyrosine-protein phosphatase n2 [Plakobranchus ocellatus]|uniref:Receptor-type tyrosine-protein phosphatase n2 n=1 Tax=Plakobranchus ocellatus TaxID=259542 RepID=A0AAV4BWC5_9GAST|nr:receptor-type tyrosine-protein phosphatase n2 [Plakobranchus ocellatus]
MVAFDCADVKGNVLQTTLSVRQALEEEEVYWFGVISANLRTACITVQGSLTASRYINQVLAPQLIPFLHEHPDRLFGSCQSLFSRVVYGEPHFTLTSSEILRLERQIITLVQAGFTWKDAFTQCILQNTLIGFTQTRSEARNYQLHRLCEDALGVAGSYREDISGPSEEEATEEAINSEIASILLRLLASAENLDGARPDDRDIASLVPSENSGVMSEQPGLSSSRLMKELLRSSQKRDEIVQVHKYFDKSKGTWKRDPYVSGYYKEQEPRSSLNPYSLYYPMASSNNVAARDLYSPNYGSMKQDENVFDSDGNWARDEDDVLRNAVLGSDQIATQGYPETEDADWEQIIDSLVLSEEDKQALQGLLNGSIQPRDLDAAQQKRLQVFIEILINVLEGSSGSLEQETPQTEDQLLLDAAMTEDANAPAGDEELEPLLASDSERPSDDLTADADENLSKVETIPDDLVDLTYAQEEEANSDGNNKELIEDASVEDSDVQVDKKMIDHSVEDGDETLGRASADIPCIPALRPQLGRACAGAFATRLFIPCALVLGLSLSKSELSSGRS